MKCELVSQKEILVLLHYRQKRTTSNSSMQQDAEI
jgi:hypothetical protein